jgi:hypothetical protein
VSGFVVEAFSVALRAIIKARYSSSRIRLNIVKKGQKLRSRDLLVGSSLVVPGVMLIVGCTYNNGRPTKSVRRSAMRTKT